jgi:glycosyltransferase involved in cell wall biosynthesis
MTIDIFIPFWGDPDLLIETIESVRTQTDPDWRLTVVDDAYPDDSVGDRVTALGDDRITYVRNETNRGITDNYRVCVERATADVLVLLGCDDLLHPNYVEVIKRAHARYPEAAVIQPGVRLIDDRGHRILPMADRVKRRLMPRGPRCQQLAGEALACSLLRGNWLYWPSLAFRTDRIRAFEFRAGLPIVQDLAIVLDMVFAGDSLVLDRTECFSYRRHSGSASAASVFDGRRFAGDRTYFASVVQQAHEAGWLRAERIARRRVVSRLHALWAAPRNFQHSLPDD